ncbi:MAG: hypothetical protein F6J98_19815 [Moorea sp. SIO4G2]|nr:hypothetical protein [Moorena sp. SIO4G2]
MGLTIGHATRCSFGAPTRTHLLYLVINKNVATHWTCCCVNAIVFLETWN